MKMKFTIDYPENIGQFGMNAIYSGKHWTKRNNDKELWHLLTRAALNKANIPNPGMFNKPVQITFRWNDGFDIDNHAYMAKMITDALKGRIIQDDNRKNYTRAIHEFHDKKYIEVEIEELM